MSFNTVKMLGWGVGCSTADQLSLVTGVFMLSGINEKFKDETSKPSKLFSVFQESFPSDNPRDLNHTITKVTGGTSVFSAGAALVMGNRAIHHFKLHSTQAQSRIAKCLFFIQALYLSITRKRLSIFMKITNLAQVMIY